ncbi:MAG: cytochrome c3 family protein [Ardenticatenaceae bacterium]|nr:cytochrome c3 family protein [Ardenticatenaceae bacterium]
MSYPKLGRFLLGLLAVITGLLFWWHSPAYADVPQQTGDEACRLCHSDTDAVVTLPSGDEIPAQVDLAVLAQSAHGDMAESPLACADCHQTINDYQFPHTPVEAADLRAFQLEKSSECQRCHVQPHLTSHPNDVEAGNVVACVDCHGGHDVQPVESWHQAGAAATCAACHSGAGVELVDEGALTAVIQNGLFTDQVDNDYCLACHSLPGLEITFANGETKSATIDGEAFHASVHGVDSERPLNCVNCHENYKFPHEPVTAESARAYSLEKYPVCANCHEPKYEQAQDSVHEAALAEGNLDAAVCTDCHGAHDTPVPNEPRERISHTCQQCHSTIFDEYATSVHGDALLSESNPDVPTCIECHGVHNIGDPTTNLFRIRSPQLCAECHADEELMAEYEISTQVFDTYVADFHGSTVTIFEHQDPTVETNKAVCYDCHGVHAILAPDDPEAGIKANLLATCQQCHPDATANFPDSWTSHFEPSPEHNPLVYYVNLFYKIVIPLTVGFFAFMVLTDIYRRIRLSLK